MLPDSHFILALGTLAAQNVYHKRAPWHREPGGMEHTLCENKAVAILEQMQAGRPALIQKMAAKCLLPFETKSSLIAQMIKPAGSSDPLLQTVQPVALAAMNTTALVRQCSSSNRKWSTWGTHGCYLLRRYHCAIQVLCFSNPGHPFT